MKLVFYIVVVASYCYAGIIYNCINTIYVDFFVFVESIIRNYVFSQIVEQKLLETATKKMRLSMDIGFIAHITLHPKHISVSKKGIKHSIAKTK